MGLLSILAEIIEENDKNKKKDDNEDLMPWEQDLVDKGEYEPYHFEEDMDEDDHYFEDD